LLVEISDYVCYNSRDLLRGVESRSKSELFLSREVKFFIVSVESFIYNFFCHLSKPREETYGTVVAGVCGIFVLFRDGDYCCYFLLFGEVLEFNY
jgi:hypothetical protein